METMKLGVVGHGANKFNTPELIAEAHERIRRNAEALDATHIVSGHSPLGGVDLYAEAVAQEMGQEMVIHAPTRRTWSGPGGYKERNLAIARDSDIVLVVVVDKLPPNFQGWRPPKGCYHCRNRNPLHVKSGGCWTAWQAKERMWEIIEVPNG